jgi:hypothetical protein
MTCTPTVWGTTARTVSLYELEVWTAKGSKRRTESAEVSFTISEGSNALK